MKNPNKQINQLKLAIGVLAIVCYCSIALMACNDALSNSDKIYINDFSDTYTISVKAKVKNHSTLPGATRTFEYGKGLDKLYESIVATPPYDGWVRLENNIIFVDIVEQWGRIYSCIIYPSQEKNTYMVDSMTYVLGNWADNRSIFFPAYTLDKKISFNDDEGTTYQCSLSIEELKTYYTQRGYWAEINDNELRVVCLLRYPSVFEGKAGAFGRKAISWSIIYDDDRTIRFADICDRYERSMR